MPDSPRPLALRLLTLSAVAGCAILLYALLAGATWGVALAIVGWPLHRRLAARTSYGSGAAAVSTTAVMLSLLVPIVLVGVKLVGEARVVKKEADKQAASGQWRESLARVPYVGPWAAEQIADESPEDLVRLGLARLGGMVAPLAGGVAAAGLHTLVAAFVLFFAFRDGPGLVRQLEAMLPTDAATASRLTGRAADAVHATVAGTLLTGALQGVTGGLLFWSVGLPAPVLWGVAMFVVSVLPVLGAFIVWVPAAAYLAGEGEWGRAVAVVAWGVLMAGPICNAVYARLAGDRMRLNPVVSLLAFIGGLAAFGVSGMVLGPVLVAVAAELVAYWTGPTGDAAAGGPAGGA